MIALHRRNGMGNGEWRMRVSWCDTETRTMCWLVGRSEAGLGVVVLETGEARRLRLLLCSSGLTLVSYSVVMDGVCRGWSV